MKPRTSSVVEIVVIGLLVLGIVALLLWVVWSMPGCSVDQRLGRIEAALQHVETNTATASGRDSNINDRWTMRILAAGIILSYPIGKVGWLVSGWARAKVANRGIRAAARGRLKP